MDNDKPLKWKLKLTAELRQGECVEYDVTGWERGAGMTLGSLGLRLAEGKALLAEIQIRMVAAQIEGQEETRRCFGRCGRRLPNEGHYRSTFRSAFGNLAVLAQKLQAAEIQRFSKITHSVSTAYRNNPLMFSGLVPLPQASMYRPFMRNAAAMFDKLTY